MEQQPGKRKRLGRDLAVWLGRVLAVAGWLGGALALLWAMWRVYAPAPGLATYAMLLAGLVLMGLGAAVAVSAGYPWGGVGSVGLAGVMLAGVLVWLARRAPVAVYMLPTVLALALVLYGMVRARLARS